MPTQISLLSQADDAADQLLRFTNKWLKPAAHVCLLSTFFDDTLRMLFQWEDQASFFVRACLLCCLGCSAAQARGACRRSSPSCSSSFSASDRRAISPRQRP